MRETTLKHKIIGGIVGVALAVAAVAVAQQGGSGRPGGANNSTQYRVNSTTFGGAGPGAAGEVLTSNGAGSPPSFQPAGGGVTPSALTRTNDTNVTITLGGTPATALLEATSLTMGWSGTLAASRGGLGISTVTDDTTIVANGTAWVSTAIPNCTDTGGNHLNYTTATNAFSCGTSGGGATPVTGSFTITWDDACTVSPTTAVDYSQLGTVVTWRLGTMSGTNCTSDSSNFATTATIVPAGIRPTVQLQIPIPQVKNNSLDTQGCIVLRTNGTVAVDFTSTTACVGGSWTSSGSKNVVGYTPTSITYLQ